MLTVTVGRRTSIIEVFGAVRNARFRRRFAGAQELYALAVAVET